MRVSLLNKTFGLPLNNALTHARGAIAFGGSNSICFVLVCFALFRSQHLNLNQRPLNACLDLTYALEGGSCVSRIPSVALNVRGAAKTPAPPSGHES